MWEALRILARWVLSGDGRIRYPLYDNQSTPGHLSPLE